MQKNNSKALFDFSCAIAKKLLQEPNCDIEELKKIYAKKYGAPMAKNAKILSMLPSRLKTKKIILLLKTRPSRTGSGVSPIAIMPKPYPCPGKCTYCPTALANCEKNASQNNLPKNKPQASQNKMQTSLAQNNPPKNKMQVFATKSNSNFEPATNVASAKKYCRLGCNEMFAPKSYTGFEPATMRAIQCGYDAKKQIDLRICQYEALGQQSEKCELIIMGGTFLSIPKSYADDFILECFNTLNNKNSSSLAQAKKLNETARHRVVGLTIETRPDWCKKEHILRMLNYGATRVELGVQSLLEPVLKKVKRGHGVQETIRATADLKNAGFKVCYHFMPGLYATHKQDVQMLTELFSNPSFCPDMLKLYPCLVMEGTELYQEYKKGKFSPISTQEAVSRICDASKYFAPWVRIMRMQRDIPAQKICAGVKNGNLHQLVDAELERRGERLNDIRSREIFSLQRKGKAAITALSFELYELKYLASGGIEYFLSFEDKKNKLLAGFLRMRFPPTSFVPQINSDTAIIRELHIYGEELPIGAGAKNMCLHAQHSGFGKRLLLHAEQLARKEGKTKIAIISGVGVREYYRKFGYKLEGAYMCKKLT